MKCKVNVVLANEFEGSPVVTFSPHADSTREKVSFWRTKRTKSCRRITRVLGSSTMQISSLFRLTVTITGNSLYILRIKSHGSFYDGLKKSVTKQRKVRETTTSPIIRKFLDSIYYFFFFITSISFRNNKKGRKIEWKKNARHYKCIILF